MKSDRMRARHILISLLGLAASIAGCAPHSIPVDPIISADNSRLRDSLARSSYPHADPARKPADPIARLAADAYWTVEVSGLTGEFSVVDQKNYGHGDVTSNYDAPIWAFGYSLGAATCAGGACDSVVAEPNVLKACCRQSMGPGVDFLYIFGRIEVDTARAMLRTVHFTYQRETPISDFGLMGRRDTIHEIHLADVPYTIASGGALVARISGEALQPSVRSLVETVDIGKGGQDYSESHVSKLTRLAEPQPATASIAITIRK